MNDPSPLVVTGASGLVGQALARRHPISALGRGGGAWSWDSRAGTVSDDGRRVAAVVHLAGASVAEGRWTDDRRAEIRASRVRGTRAIVDWIGSRAQRPSVLVCASAVGFYGDRGDAELDEGTAKGRGFLSDVCAAWETEAARAADFGVRVVSVRLGVVLSVRGGSLAKMLPVFRVGGGGPLGGGRQWFPWVHEDDVARAILHVVRADGVSGPVNVVAPDPVQQRDFARALGGVLGRPAVVPAPALALRAALGRGMADELILASQKVVPRRLEDSGFTFAHPSLGGALAQLLAHGGA